MEVHHYLLPQANRFTLRLPPDATILNVFTRRFGTPETSETRLYVLLGDTPFSDETAVTHTFHLFNVYEPLPSACPLRYVATFQRGVGVYQLFEEVR